MRTAVFLLYLLYPLASNGQKVNDNVLLVEHNNPRRQYFYAEGNKITFFTRQGQRAAGVLVELTDSTVRVDNRSYKLEDIAKIKRRTAGTYAKVIGGIFILNGTMFILAAGSDLYYSGAFVATGLAFIALGLPFYIEPSFKVGRNCRLRVVTHAAYVNRR